MGWGSNFVVSLGAPTVFPNQKLFIHVTVFAGSQWSLGQALKLPVVLVEMHWLVVSCLSPALGVSTVLLGLTDGTWALQFFTPVPVVRAVSALP